MRSTVLASVIERPWYEYAIYYHLLTVHFTFFISCKSLQRRALFVGTSEAIFSTDLKVRGDQLDIGLVCLCIKIHLLINC